MSDPNKNGTDTIVESNNSIQADTVVKYYKRLADLYAGVYKTVKQSVKENSKDNEKLV